MQDVLAAMITHFKTVSGVTDLVSTRVFGGKLPEDQVASMPRKCLVIRYNGGPEEFRQHREQRVRLEFLSMGEDPEEAASVDLAVCEALLAISRLVVASTMIFSAAYAGPYMRVDPDAGWDYVRRSAMIRAGETTAA